MRTKSIKIKTKIMLAIALIAAICSIVVGIIVYMSFKGSMIEHSKENAMALVTVAANEVDGEMFASIDSAECEAFSTVYDILSKYKDADTIDYIYSMAKDGDKLCFIVDTDEEDPADYGEEYEWLEDMQPAFDGEVCCDSEVTTDEWGSYYSAYAPIRNGSEVVGIVGVDIPVTSIEEDMKSIRYEITVIVLIAVVISMLLAFIFSLSLGRNLERFYNKVKELNSGEGDLTRKLDITSKDELEEIAGEFNIFIENIRSVFEAFAHSVEEIETSSGNVSSMSDDNAANISNITMSLQSLAAQMQETSATTGVIMDHLSSVTAAVKNLDERARDRSENASKVSLDADRRHEEIVEVGDKTADIIRKLDDDLQIALEETKAVERIDEITDQILKVAKTTKILALNAHTEAARAGAAGQGFNIIADNVGQLSNQISTLVMNIQTINQQVKEAVANLANNVNRMTEFMSENVMNDYGEFAKMGQEYSTNMSRMAEILKHVCEITEVINSTISDVDVQLSGMETVIVAATDEINGVHTLSMDIKTENDRMSDIADDNVTEVRSMHEEFNRFKY